MSLTLAILAASAIAQTISGLNSASDQQAAAEQARQQSITDSVDNQNKLQADLLLRRRQAQATGASTQVGAGSLLGGQPQAQQGAQQASLGGGTLLTDNGGQSQSRRNQSLLG